MRAVMLMVVPLAFMVLGACESGTGGTSGAGGGTTSSSTSGGGTGGETTSSSSSSSSGTGGMTSSSSGGGSGGAPTQGVCKKSCAVPKDCCPPGAPASCPTTLPLKFGCENQICKQLECVDDAECGTQKCVGVDGSKRCVSACIDNAGCTAPALCDGKSDDGAVSFCVVASEPFKCVDGDTVACGGFGFCQANACVCTSSQQCSGLVDACVP